MCWSASAIDWMKSGWRMVVISEDNAIGAGHPTWSIVRNCPVVVELSDDRTGVCRVAEEGDRQRLDNSARPTLAVLSNSSASGQSRPHSREARDSNPNRRRPDDVAR